VNKEKTIDLLDAVTVLEDTVKKHNLNENEQEQVLVFIKNRFLDILNIKRNIKGGKNERYLAE